jgi:hypothetical protein
METVMRTKFRKIGTVAVAVVIATLAVGGLAKWTMFATDASAVETARVGMSPFDIMLKSDLRKLPFEQFKDGECPDRC